MCLYQLLQTFIQSILLQQSLATHLTSSIRLLKKKKKRAKKSLNGPGPLDLGTDQEDQQACIRKHTTIIYFICLQGWSALFPQLFYTIPITPEEKSRFNALNILSATFWKQGLMEKGHWNSSLETFCYSGLWPCGRNHISPRQALSICKSRDKLNELDVNF